MAQEVAPVPSVTPAWSRPDDAVRQAQLDAMKRQATGLLALAGVIFVGASLFERAYPWLGYVRATAEASLVGGLADWFAVTALFRHPLGLPIPHTAIVATRKERIGRILGNFVQNHFLSRDVIALNLRAVHPAERAARWLSDPAHSRQIARQLAGGLAKTLEALPDEDARELVRQVVSTRVRATRVAPALGRTLALLVMGVFMVNAEQPGSGGPIPAELWNVLMSVGVVLVWLAPPRGEPARGRLWLRLAGAALLVALLFLYRSPDATGLIQIRPHWWGILGLIGWSYLVAASLYVLARDRPAVLLAGVALLYCVYLADEAGGAGWLVALAPYFRVGRVMASHSAVALSGTVLGVMLRRHRQAGEPVPVADPREQCVVLDLRHIFHGLGSAVRSRPRHDCRGDRQHGNDVGVPDQPSAASSFQ